MGALLLGEFVDRDLRYLGQVGSPSDARVMRAVVRALSPSATSPFKDAIPDRGARFCAPALRVGVEFLDFTDDGYLRQPAFRRFDDDAVTGL
jgi:bifunctional non-homologous end joining protein LigD